MADEPEHFVCQCFFTHNIFLNDYEAHVTFKSKVQFENEYRKVRGLISGFLDIFVLLQILSLFIFYFYYFLFSFFIFFLLERNFITEAVQRTNSGKKCLSK